jgi:calcium-dependent protein kinase
MLYILLCGFPPFSGSNEKAIFRNVMSQPLDFSQNPWPKISEPAKDCVRRMLQRDPKKRATAQV